MLLKQHGKGDGSPPSALCVCSVFIGLVLRDGVQIRLDVAVQNEVCIGRRGVVDEVVRLRPLIKIIRRFVFHGGAVDGDHAAVLKPQLHTARVHVEFKAFSGFNCPSYPLTALFFFDPLGLDSGCFTTPFLKCVSSNSPKKTNNPNQSPIKKIWFGLYWFVCVRENLVFKALFVSVSDDKYFYLPKGSNDLLRFFLHIFSLILQQKSLHSFLNPPHGS